MLRRLLRAAGLVSSPTHYGSAAWAAPNRELIRARNRGWKTDSGWLEEGEVFVGTWKERPVALPRLDALRHGIIVGGSGSGKSRGYILPNAAWGAGKGSLVCTDPKSELWRMTSGFHPQAVRFAPTEPWQSECFNWIPLCLDPRIAELSARAIVESGNTHATEQAWLDTEASYLAGVFAHAATLDIPTPLTAYRLITTLSAEDLIETLLGSVSHVARDQAMIFSQTQERMRGSIVPVVAARLAWLRDPLVARFTSASIRAPAFGALRLSPAALYWCLRESDIARLRPLTSLFFTLLLEQLAEGNQDGEGVPVTMLLDEFANVGAIPNFDSTITLARGRGVSLWLGVQSLSQLEARYGKPNAATILANCGTKIALSGLDVDSAEYFSRTLGDETSDVAKVSRHGLLNASYSHSRNEHARRLLTADEIRRLPSDQAIVVSGNRRPMRLGKIFYEGAPSRSQAGTLSEAQAAMIEVPRRPELPPWPDFELPDQERPKGGRRRLLGN